MWWKIVLTVLFLTIFLHVPLSVGEANDIVVLTYKWVLVDNISFHELPGYFIVTEYTPDDFKYTVEDGFLYVEKAYHIALNLSVLYDKKYWLIAAKVEPVRGFYGKPPRIGIGGFNGVCNTIPCPRYGYWISTINIYPNTLIYQLQGHCSYENGKWYYSKDIRLVKNKTYTLFFAKLGEYVAGGIWGEPDTVFYFRDTVGQPILTVYGSSAKIYWLAIYIPSPRGERIIPYLPLSRVNGNIIINNPLEKILLVSPTIEYRYTKTFTITKVRTKTIETTITKTSTIYKTQTATITTTIQAVLETRATYNDSNPCQVCRYLLLATTITTIVLSILLVRESENRLGPQEKQVTRI